jgi:ADP-ribosyl-[dinitrogen reductase] hydrolase
MSKKNISRDILFGIATGDAVGVPFEFMSREKMRQGPAVDMIGYGTHNLPPGTWSDDSSLSFCLAESLASGFDLNAVAQNFVRWHDEGYWTPWGYVFDIGISTRHAIYRIQRGTPPALAGGMDESENGNGSLMRILPLLLYIKDKPADERFELTKMVSSITHAHVRSVIACFYYLEYARLLLETNDKLEAYFELQKSLPAYLNFRQIAVNEIDLFSRLLQSDISECGEAEIQSSGYVLHTLEASVWSFLTTDNYRDAVLRAVNLGEDTDTTAAVVGGLSGIYYGVDSIPGNWVAQLAKKDDIDELAGRLDKKLSV